MIIKKNPSIAHILSEETDMRMKMGTGLAGEMMDAVQ